ncbi:DegT/DnrJ/EryC1/StrS family aminotransferase [Phytohabitans kaempferiae]|uniref:DegT/DnrJ/EryC1/StrS family aminotransferase n=1 Tax=Phytohabitans kaempferiae TaxID=1620943 RepID=A0ABV6MCI1_9ACTN
MTDALEHLRFPSVAEAAGRTIGAEEVEAVTRVLRSGMLNSVWGTETRALEREMAALHGVGHAVAASSGTAAIHLAVAAAGPDPGDEIITSPITDFGTVGPILAQNAVPVFADVDPVTGNLDPAAVESAIGPRTKAIVAVHLFGATAPAELRQIADRHGVPLIEDCAQAWLARYPDGRLAGTAGAIGCFSLQQWKHITCGDGGLTITDDADLARRMRLFADKGWPRDKGRRHQTFGLNYRMTELQAAVARAQLAKLPGVLARRRATAHRLLAELGPLPGLHLAADVDRHAWWLMPIVLDAGLPVGNQEFASALAARGIPARPGYLEEALNHAPALTGAPVYGSSRFPLDAGHAPAACPRADQLVGRTLVVLDWNEAYTEEHVTAVVAAIRAVHREVTGR